MSRAKYMQNFDLGDDWRLAIGAIVREMDSILEDVEGHAQEKLLTLDKISWRNLVANIGHDPVQVKDNEIRGTVGVAKTPRTMHAWAVEAGLKAGKWRPIDPLQAWAEKKFGVDEDEARAIAVGTQRKLHARGTEGVFYMRDALELVADDAARRLETAMETALDS